MSIFVCISVDAHMSLHVCGGQRMSLVIGVCFPPGDSQLLFATVNFQGVFWLHLPSHLGAQGLLMLAVIPSITQVLGTQSQILI